MRKSYVDPNQSSTNYLTGSRWFAFTIASIPNTHKFLVLEKEHFVRYSKQDEIGKNNFLPKKSDGKEFACKIYKTDVIFEKNQQIWVLNELRMLLIISQDEDTQCSRIINIFEGKNYIYVVNELIAGHELLEWIIDHRHDMDESTALTALYSILKALVYLEDKEIVHRDIKPSNILLRNSEELTGLVLVDFGLALT